LNRRQALIDDFSKQCRESFAVAKVSRMRTKGLPFSGVVKEWQMPSLSALDEPSTLFQPKRRIIPKRLEVYEIGMYKMKKEGVPNPSSLSIVLQIVEGHHFPLRKASVFKLLQTRGGIETQQRMQNLSGVGNVIQGMGMGVGGGMNMSRNGIGRGIQMGGEGNVGSINNGIGGGMMGFGGFGNGTLMGGNEDDVILSSNNAIENMSNKSNKKKQKISTKKKMKKSNNDIESVQGKLLGGMDFGNNVNGGMGMGGMGGMPQ
jgi:hypothetical protein